MEWRGRGIRESEDPSYSGRSEEGDDGRLMEKKRRPELDESRRTSDLRDEFGFASFFQTPIHS